MKNVAFLLEYFKYLFGLVHVFLWIKNVNFVIKLLNLYQNIYGDAQRNYDNSLYKKFITMITMSKIVFILKFVNAY